MKLRLERESRLREIVFCARTLTLPGSAAHLTFGHTPNRISPFPGQLSMPDLTGV